ncbi:MAG TPA: histidine phosphatase family protein [Mycobacteriales bacterium]|nr:histidine phosphatase family protein [Mycobacteriales bacterium]
MAGQQVVLVRHGETEWTRTGQHTGRTDIALTDRGCAEATAVRPLLEGYAFTWVASSPQARAVQTAELAGVALDETLADLREWDYGDYEGRTSEDIRSDVPGWTVWSHPVPAGESLHDVATRADRVLERVRAVSGDVLLFGHGHQLRVLAARWCELEPVVGRRLALDPASVSVLSYERDTPVLAHWNRPAQLGPA